jgi:hypothetical protein
MDELCALDVFDACEKRAVCLACDRPRKVCWCAFVASPKIRISSRIVIVQHPKERTRRIRTAHMAAMAIADDKCVIERESRSDSGLDFLEALCVVCVPVIQVWNGPISKSAYFALTLDFLIKLLARIENFRLSALLYETRSSF